MGTVEASRWQAEQMTRLRLTASPRQADDRIKINHGRRTRKSTENEIKNGYVLRSKRFRVIS